MRRKISIGPIGMFAVSGLGLLALGPATAQVYGRTGVLAGNPNDIPPPVITNAPQGSVILRSARTDAVIRTLPILRQTSLVNIRSKPTLKLDSAQLDFRPMLNNPRAPFNVAAQLRAKPNLANVIADETTVYEVSSGVIIHSTVTYRLRSGVCRSSWSRAGLMGSGVDCARPLNDSEFTAAFSRPGDARYVADPRLRGRAIADARAKRLAQKAELDTDVAGVRAALSNPAQRALLDQDVGSSESARLASLTDDELMGEMVNAGETTVEQTYFVPRLDKPALSKYEAISPAASPGAIFKGGPGLSIKGAQIGADQPVTAVPPVIGKKRDLETRFFLTGFTLGRSYEWRQRVSKTVGWCKVACKKYHVEVYAGFSYGFGLRFPMRMGGQYEYHSENGIETAKLTTNFEPINGSAEEYVAAGLPDNQLFDGKELVAEAKAYAGASYKLPTLGSASVQFDAGVDFTADLPSPFTNGQFRPPAPGEGGFPPLIKIFDQIDLIGGRASFGIAGAKVFPAIKAQLQSDGLRFRLRDLVSGQSTLLTATGQVTPLGIRLSDHGSSFTLGDPDYQLSFLTTPGLDARLYIDVYVWSHNWDWPVWFPQLAVKLPPDGASFACHSGTVCTRAYGFSPDGQTESTGPLSAADLEAQEWENTFLNTWLPKCLTETCKTAIKDLAKETAAKLKIMLQNKSAAGKSGPFGMPNFASQAQTQFAIDQLKFSVGLKADAIIKGSQRVASPATTPTTPSALPPVTVRPGLLRPIVVAPAAAPEPSPAPSPTPTPLPPLRVRPVLIKPPS